ncbi:hypothetical protein NEISICOT_01459 [Neisseria sicca ATCC 29256]|uniref:Uncharacterized protein n=1 Tax=Neisseria sicca ATCC 29256 TaxID=547045 RepID=C6M4L3_NEISI|nr:hypothetical protein NEISICOT_01459 [Neisseria sicca ATCC 29256]
MRSPQTIIINVEHIRLICFQTTSLHTKSIFQSEPFLIFIVCISTSIHKNIIFNPHDLMDYNDE